MQVPEDFCHLYINQNLFMKDFTKYEYRIYLYSDCRPNMNIEYIHCLQQDRIRISNTFVLSKLAKYEYRIYSQLENGEFVFEYLIFGALYLNIRKYLCYTGLH